jgi:hypothetical protein
LLPPVNPKTADRITIGSKVWLDDDGGHAGLLLIEAECFVEEECLNTEAHLKARFNGLGGLRT